MKKQLLFTAALFAATLGVNAQQVSSVAELKAAIEEAATAEVEITIADAVTLDFEAELDNESIIIPSSVTSLSIEGGGGNSNVILRSQFLKPSSQMDKLEIKGINFSSPVTTDHYLFNLDAEDIEIDFFNIENCTATTMRGFFRMKDHETIKVNLLSINNCVVTNIGNYNFVTIDKGTITTLEVINNTLYDFADARLIRFQNPADDATEVRLTNFIMRKNTLNNVIASGNYIGDFGKVGGTDAMPVTGDFIFTDNLLGTSKAGAGVNTKAFSKVDYDTYESSDNYISTDWSMEGVDKFFEVLTIGVNELFEDAENGNFTISSDAVYKEAGDPRWNGTEPVKSIYDAGEGPGTSIGAIDSSAEVIATEYYDISGLKYSVAPKGLVIVKNILSDGSVKVTKAHNK